MTLQVRRKKSRRRRRPKLALAARMVATHCCYCKQQISRIHHRHKRYPTADHYIPKSRNGTDDKSNIVVACMQCNNEKGNMMPDEFTVYLRVTAGIPNQTARRMTWRRFCLENNFLPSELKPWLTGKPYYCKLCGAGGGERHACEEPDCELESEDEAKARVLRAQVVQVPAQKE